MQASSAIKQVCMEYEFCYFIYHVARECTYVTHNGMNLVLNLVTEELLLQIYILISTAYLGQKQSLNFCLINYIPP